MFKLIKNPEFSHEVRVSVPVDGGYLEQKFTCRFAVVDWEELRQLENDPAAQVRKVWIGWEGLVDDEDRPIPFSDPMRDTLIGMLFVRAAVLQAYVTAVTGARRGN